MVKQRFFYISFVNGFVEFIDEILIAIEFLIQFSALSKQECNENSKDLIQFEYYRTRTTHL